MRAINQNLSGGQIQRLVVARAILRDAPLLLFDEATSNLDEETEYALTSAVLEHCRNSSKSLIGVTHRMGLLDRFDEVFFIDRGEILFRGAHSELMKKQRYRDFYESGRTNEKRSQ